VSHRIVTGYPVLLDFHLSNEANCIENLLKYEYNNILIGPDVYDIILNNTGRGTYEGEKNRKIFAMFLKSILLVNN
jgi:hypothetical protein